MLDQNKPKVIIENKVFQKIMYWVNKSEYEVSGLGILRVEDGGILRVVDAMLLPQKNGATHTDIEPEDAAKLMFRMKDTPGDLRFWWHSHVNMAVFWSGTDMDTIQKLGAGGWFLSTVFNKKREMRSAYYAVHGSDTPWGKQELFLDELETAVTPFVHAEQNEWDQSYTENVTVAAARWTPSKYGDGSLWPDDYADLDDYYGRSGVSAGKIGAHVSAYGKRPHGMSKDEWKQMKKAMKREGGRPAALKPPGLSSPSLIGTDDYGFTRDERGYLAQEGWDEHDIDELIDFDVTPSEMLKLAPYATPEEIQVLLDKGWAIKGIFTHFGITDEDTPVADRVRNEHA